VNIIGSFLMGVLIVLFLERFMVSTEAGAAVLVGGLGHHLHHLFHRDGSLIEQAYYLRALVNALTNMALCSLACWVGVMLGRSI